MPVLEVEGGSLGFLCPPPGFQPDTLADLVADRLAGKAEVAVDFAGGELLREVDVVVHHFIAQVGAPRLSGVEFRIGRDGQAQVHSDVDDHPDGPECLGVEHSHVVIGVCRGNRVRP